MTEDHERIEELLAGYALRALDPADAEEAERALAEHVPSCASCRATLADFQAVAGELGLAAPPAEPSELLATRIRRSIGEPGVERGSRLRLLMAGAAAALVVALGATTALLATQVSRAEAFQDAMAEGFRTLANPEAESVDMAEEAKSVRLYVTYLPGSDRMVLMGLNLPAPEEGEVYRLWGVRGGDSRLLAEFRPDDDGLVAIKLEGTPERFDQLVCTSETGDPGTRPGHARWVAPVGGIIPPE